MLEACMMTRTYELIYETRKEWKRQWAQVILMIELSINPKQRLMALLKYSRPIGTDKRKRAFVVTKKIEVNTTASEQIKKVEHEKTKIEEKKMILKRRLKDALGREGRRSGIHSVTTMLGSTASLGQIGDETDRKNYLLN